MERLRVLITIKTYPIPSAKYDELVCAAGVAEDQSFVRLYPINFRDLPFSQQYTKYQWIEVDAERHKGRDRRKESSRPNCESLEVVSGTLPTAHNWQERSKYVMPLVSQSMEELWDRQKADDTSLGIFRPREVMDLEIRRDDAEWKPKFLEALKQARLWETRKRTRQPPLKVPWKFYYRFACNDPRCRGKHRMMIEDWEVGALYWREVRGGKSSRAAAESVRYKFLNELCGPGRDTYFYVGTVLGHSTWVVIGDYYPKAAQTAAPTLFDLGEQ